MRIASLVEVSVWDWNRALSKTARVSQSTHQARDISRMSYRLISRLLCVCICRWFHVCNDAMLNCLCQPEWDTSYHGLADLLIVVTICCGAVLLMPQVEYLCSFTTSSFPDSLALVKGEQLSLGATDSK